MSLLKKKAQDKEELDQSLAQLPIGKHLFEVQDRGAGRFPYVLVDNCFRIQVKGAAAKLLPLAYVQVSSEYLAAVGVEEAELGLRFCIESLGLVEGEAMVARVDLFVDFISAPLTSAEDGEDVLMKTILDSSATRYRDENINPHLMTQSTPRSYCGAIFLVREIGDLRCLALPIREPVSYIGRKIHRALTKSDLSQETFRAGLRYNRVWLQDAIISPASDKESLIGLSFPFAAGSIFGDRPSFRFLKEVSKDEHTTHVFIIFLRLGNLMCPVYSIYGILSSSDMRNVFGGGAALISGHLGIAKQRVVAQLINSDFQSYWYEFNEARFSRR